jgi:hypothetical protein
MLRGIYNYFKCTDEFYRLSQIFSFLKFSYYKTLVSKYKVGTIQKLFNKFGSNLEKLTDIKIVKLDTKKVPLIKCIKKINEISPETYENNFNKIWLSDTSDVLKMCFLCNSDKNLESHHVKSVKNLREKYNLHKNKYKLYN